MGFALFRGFVRPLGVVGLGIAVLGSHAAQAATPAPLASMTNRLATMAGYRASVALFERAGSRVQRATYDYSYTKPSHVTLHVVSGASAGDTLDWNGGSTVVAHKSGLLSAFKRTLSLHDPLTTTIRGSSVDELSFPAIVAHIRSTPGALHEASGGLVDGVPTTALTLVPRSPATDRGYTREVVDLAKTTHLPVRVLGYSGSSLVRQVDFSNVTPQPSGTS